MRACARRLRRRSSCSSTQRRRGGARSRGGRARCSTSRRRARATCSSCRRSATTASKAGSSRCTRRCTRRRAGACPSRSDAGRAARRSRARACGACPTMPGAGRCPCAPGLHRPRRASIASCGGRRRCSGWRSTRTSACGSRSCSTADERGAALRGGHRGARRWQAERAQVRAGRRRCRSSAW